MNLNLTFIVPSLMPLAYLRLRIEMEMINKIIEDVCCDKEAKEEKMSRNKKWRLILESDGDLTLFAKGEKTRVNLKPCFPWTTPGKYFSLVNKDGEEVEFVADANTLDDNSKKAVNLSLAEAGFCFQVINIIKVEEEFELRRWWVETQQGHRQFQTKLLDWPRVMPGGGLLVQDVHGDLFYIKDPSRLPSSGKKMLSAFID